MALTIVKVLLAASIVSHWSVSISVSKAVYQKGREYYQQGLAEYRKTGDDKNISHVFNLLQEACEQTNYTIPTFVHDYAFALHTARDVDPDVVISVIEHGIIAQLDLWEQASNINNVTAYNSAVFDHKHEILLYAKHLIDVYDVIHEHMGLGWEELGLVLQVYTSRRLPWQRLTDFLLRSVGSSYTSTGGGGDIDSDENSNGESNSNNGKDTSTSGGIDSEIRNDNSADSSDKSNSNNNNGKDTGSQSEIALNHTLEFIEYHFPFDCSARHEDKGSDKHQGKGSDKHQDQGSDKHQDQGSDNYYDNLPVWSRDELEALPYSVSDLLNMLTEGLWLRPRDPALLYTLAVMYSHIHEQPTQPSSHQSPLSPQPQTQEPHQSQEAPPQQPLQPPPVNRDNSNDTTTSAIDLLYAHLQLQYPSCCISRYLARALATSTHALPSSPVTCYLESGAMYRQWKRARQLESEFSIPNQKGVSSGVDQEGVSVRKTSCVCPGLSKHVTALQEYRQRQTQRQQQRQNQSQEQTQRQLATMPSLRLFDARLFGLSDYPYDLAEQTLLAYYLTPRHSDDANTFDVDADANADTRANADTDTATAVAPLSNIATTTSTSSTSTITSTTNNISSTSSIITAASASTAGTATSTATNTVTNTSTITRSLVKLQIGCSDPSCARVGWLVADARASLVTHFQLTAALYPVNRNVDGAGNGDDRNDNCINGDYSDGNGNCTRDCVDCDIDCNNDDIIPAGSVDVLYSSHTLEHVSHYHSDDHDEYYFNRLSKTSEPDVTGATPTPSTQPSASPIARLPVSAPAPSPSFATASPPASPSSAPPAPSTSTSPAPPAESVTVVLRRWRRVLRPGGVLLVSVPDLTQLAAMILDTKTFVSFKDKHTLISVLYGGQDYPENYHQAGFTYDILEHYLTEAKFCDVEKVDRESFRMFEDTSRMTLGGYNISLSVRARAC